MAKPTIWILVYVYAGIVEDVFVFGTLDGAVAEANHIIEGHLERNPDHTLAWDNNLRAASCDCDEHDLHVWNREIPETFLESLKET